MKKGDKFKFNIELMKKNNIGIDDKNGETIQTVLDILVGKDLGTIIGYNLLQPDCPGYFAQINECWCIPV
jgi:hypothetical protein